MLIPIASIAIIKRDRKVFKEEDIVSLAESIKANGLIQDIVVRRPFEAEQLANGQLYVLCVGERRIRAHVHLGRDQIEAKLKEDLDPLSAKIVELDENLKRSNLTWEEETQARSEIVKLIAQRSPGIKLGAIAEEIGISIAQLSKDLSLSRAIQSDPTLTKSSSKGSAIRTAAFKHTIRTRIAAVEKSRDSDDLKQRLHTAKGEEFIKTIPSQSIDMVFSDLPYGIDYFETMKAGKTAGQVQSVYDDSADTSKEFIAAIVPELVRVIKPSGWIVLFMCYEWHQWLQQALCEACTTHAGYRRQGQYLCREFVEAAGDSLACNYLSPELPPWIWVRRGKGNHGHWPELHASNRYEMIVVVNGGSAKLTKKPVENVLDFAPMVGERSHAMQKPHDLCRELIERCTVPGERVLDICFGSGAHLAAAASLGRDFLGCEQNPELLAPAITLVAQYYKK